MSKTYVQDEEGKEEVDQGEYLEDWGNQVYKSSNLKMNYARKIYYGTNTEEKMEKPKKTVKTEENEEINKRLDHYFQYFWSLDLNLELILSRNPTVYGMRPVKRKTKTIYGNLTVCQDYTGPNLRATIPSLQKRMNYSSFKEGISNNIINILMPHGMYPTWVFDQTKHEQYYILFRSMWFVGL